MSSIANRGTHQVSLPLAACAVAALTALTTLPASAQALQGQRIVIDKDTGRARMPEHDELVRAEPALAARADARARSQAPGADNNTKSVLANHPAVQKLGNAKPAATFAGAQGRRVALDRLAFTVLRRDADGTVSSQCVAGESAADHALHASAHGGGRHER